MKIVLVTGATSGIGNATVKYLLKAGYIVYGIGRNEEQVRALKENPNFKFKAYNLEDFTNYNEIFSDGTKFDGLVHCAGIEETLPVSMYQNDIVERIFRINVFSGIELLKFFSKKKYANDGASIILLSSVMGELGQPGKVGYCGTKSAVLGVMKAAALELAKRKIRVNSVSPGVVMTPMTEKLFTQLEEENIKNIEKMHPLGFGEPDDIASIIEFLLSDKSKWITGQNFKIDGGYSSQ